MTDWLPVQTEDDVEVAAHAARCGSRQRGQSARLEGLTRELAWNLLWHAGGGRLGLFFEPDRVRVVSEDHGPGITSLRLQQPRRGLGLGLGAIRRQSDEFTLQTRAGVGTRIEAIIWWPCKSL